MRPLLTIALLLVSSVAFAQTEADHCRRLAPKYGADSEVRMWDGTRVDLMTDEYAIEVDFARKWAEGVGQAVYYGHLTGKKPGLILLAQKNEARFVYRAQTTAAAAGVRVFVEWIRPTPVPDEDAVDVNVGPLNIHVPIRGDSPYDIDDSDEDTDDKVVIPPNALRGYMIQNKDGRWLGKTLPGYINIWVFDRGAAYCWVNKQKAHQAWLSLGFKRDEAEIKTFALVPVED